MLPDQSHKSALTGIESRIAVMERRLRNAKTARDSYVDYLRNKYPDWRPMLPTYQQPGRTGEGLVSRLATADYHWDEERDRQPRRHPGFTQGRLYEEIPKSGPFLDSDVRRTRDRLSQISQQLSVMRNTRMNMTTEDYYRTKPGRHIETGLYGDDPGEFPSMEGARRRLADMAFSNFSPPATPTEEQMEERRLMQERQNMIDDIRAGRIPSVMQAVPEVFPPQLARPFQEERREPMEPELTRTQEQSKPPQQPTETRVEPQQVEQPRRGISFASHAQPEKAPTPPPPVVEQPPPKNVERPSAPVESSYSRMMSMLAGKESASDSEDSIAVVQPSKAAAATTPKAASSSKPAPPKSASRQPVMGSLSMYLSKKRGSDSSSSDDVMAATKKQVDLDSDSDFFG